VDHKFNGIPPFLLSFVEIPQKGWSWEIYRDSEGTLSVLAKGMQRAVQHGRVDISASPMGSQKCGWSWTGTGGRFASVFPHGNKPLWKVWRGCLLWTTRLCANLYSCGCEHAFHIIGPVYTGQFTLSVGDVGNRGRVFGAGGWFSNTPEFHSRDLEKGADRQP
jgi:hypothetical protein